MSRHCVLILFLFVFTSLTAQDWGLINELSYDAEYFFMTKQYDKAIKSYEQILKQLPDNANIKYKIGVCYLNTDTEKEKSIPYFNEAATNISPDYNQNSADEEGAPLETYFLLGSAYRVTNQLDKAAKAYHDYLDNLEAKDIKQKQIADHYIKACQKAIEMMANPANVITNNLGNVINNESPNFNAALSADGNTMVYTTLNRDINNIMISNKINGIWTKPKAITRQITQKNNFKSAAISADGTQLYVIEDDPFDSEIYISTLSKGRWTSAVKLKKPVNSKMNETHASLSPDGKTLYFTSDRPGGEGDLDIYFSILDEKGKWGKPVNMGPKINTVFNEETPFLSPDGNRFYFSSEGHAGMGGYDIFYFNLHESGTVPVNMGYPINTTDNDLFFVPGKNKNEGYLARIETGGFGGKDIHYIEKLSTVILTGKIMPDNHPLSVNPDIFIISLVDLTNYNSLSPLTPINDQGSFSYNLTPGKYLFSVNAPGYETFSKEFIVEKEPQMTTITIDAPMVYLPPVLAATETADLPAEETIPVIANSVTEPGEIQMPLAEAMPSEKAIVVNAEEAVKEPVAPATDIRKKNPPVTSSKTEEIPVPVIKQAALTDFTGQSFIDEVVDELNNISAIPVGTPVTYTVQLFALRKPVDLSYFRNLNGITVHLAADKLYKYTWGIAHSLEEAKNLKGEVRKMGYQDVIIRRRAVLPVYTIQLMAGKDPVDFRYFSKIDRLKVALGYDGYYRYSYGEYTNESEASDQITRFKELGYKSAFLRKL